MRSPRLRARSRAARRPSRRSRPRRIARAGLWLLAWFGAAVSAVALVAVVAPVHHYELDLAAHFAPHALLVALPGLFASLWLRRRALALSALLWAGLAAVPVPRYDRFPPASAPPEPSLTVRVVVYNAFARGAPRVDSDLDGTFRAWVEEVDADVLCLVDPPWFVERSGLWPSEQLPHVVERASEDRDFGLTLLSRWPVRLEPLADRRRPENRLSFAAHSSVIVEHPSGAEFLLTGAHPRSPRTERTWNLSFRWSRVDARLLRAWMNERPTVPVIFAGDFNTTPTGRLHAQIKRETGLRSPVALFGQGTWPSWAPPALALPIDRVWISEGARVTRAVVGPRVYSDHRPVMIEVQLPAVKRPERPQSDQ